MNLSFGTLVIYSSPDGEKWTPVLPANVPAWVKEFDNLGRLVAGEMCQKDGEDVWYRAERIETPQPVAAAIGACA